MQGFEESPSEEKHNAIMYLDEIDILAQKAVLSILETRFFTNPLTNGHIKLEILLKLHLTTTMVKFGL